MRSPKSAAGVSQEPSAAASHATIRWPARCGRIDCKISLTLPGDDHARRDRLSPILSSQRSLGLRHSSWQRRLPGQPGLSWRHCRIDTGSPRSITAYGFVVFMYRDILWKTASSEPAVVERPHDHNAYGSAISGWIWALTPRNYQIENRSLPLCNSRTLGCHRYTDPVAARRPEFATSGQPPERCNGRSRRFRDAHTTRNRQS